MRLSRFVARNELSGRTAGTWLVSGQGLVLRRTGNHWTVAYTSWLDSCTVVNDETEYRPQRRRWLIRHGLDQACFARRRDALQAVEYALQRDPLPAAEHFRPSRLSAWSTGKPAPRH